MAFKVWRLNFDPLAIRTMKDSINITLGFFLMSSNVQSTS